MNEHTLYGFADRHIGINRKAMAEMLDVIGVRDLDELIDKTVPPNIRMESPLNLPDALREHEMLDHMWELAGHNEVYRNYMGQGYYGTITPTVIRRNIFENPGWYTQYTPYQSEIAQGRLEALLNFQTMVSELTALPIANASLLDEGTAAAEGMAMVYDAANKRVKKDEDRKNVFFVDRGVFKHTIEVLKGRAWPLDIEIVTGDWKTFELHDRVFGVLVQYPTSRGSVKDYSAWFETLKEKGIYNIVAADLLSLTILKPPGEWGADVVVGNTQRFGVPMGFGGPHAAFFATIEKFKRQIPGRIIGSSIDTDGNKAYRMALQTREQHIRREKATSNICTAQALLAIMAGMYAVYQGPEKLRAIALTIHRKTAWLADILNEYGLDIINDTYFDTITIKVDDKLKERIRTQAEIRKINLWYDNDEVTIALDETCTEKDLTELSDVFSEALNLRSDSYPENYVYKPRVQEQLLRKSEYMTHPVFHLHHTETEMMRYIKSLENKDLSLVHSMIPLGSCTMKLNAATQLLPVTWPEFANIHPFAPKDQWKGYNILIKKLADYLCEITGLHACSFMPNSGAQGELTGLLTIRAYHLDRNNAHRDIALIPSSAHGTNPASAVMAGMQVVVVDCDDEGNIDLDDLNNKVKHYSDRLGALMVTYPSTHGVFESEIREICDLIHKHGGMVYLDGANMNAQVGLTSPGLIGADVCHLNLHKTFSIPHGGGGPGMGPICTTKALAPFLPGHIYSKTGGEKAIPAVAAAPFGSTSILLISYAYIRLLGTEGVTDATKYAILNANYVRAKLQEAYKVLYVGKHGHSAHEFILDLRQYKDYGIQAEDVAKRLIDYGFHAPTLSFPVPGTVMIEPTESESKAELDRFVEAMLSIREEIDEVMTGKAEKDNNVLVNAPHPLWKAVASNWPYPYTREKAVYPLEWLKYQHKFWVNVSRVDNAYGDRNLVCTCPPMEAYEMPAEV